MNPETLANKLIVSSTDPHKVSMTVKGLLVAIAPLAMIIFGINDADFNAVIEALVNVVFLGTQLLSALLIVVGLVRKLFAGRWSAYKE
jgi:sulfite exporter TauE/SafE